MKKAIIKELHDSNKLREVLEIVNTMLAILASTATTDDPSRSIGQYAEELFKQKLPPKVRLLPPSFNRLTCFMKFRLRIVL